MSNLKLLASTKNSIFIYKITMKGKKKFNIFLQYIS